LDDIQIIHIYAKTLKNTAEMQLAITVLAVSTI